MLCGAARLARFNVQTAMIGPAWSRGLPVTIAAALVSTYVLSASELGLPPAVMAASPAVLAVCAVLMVSTLWLPKTLAQATRVPSGLLALGAAAIYGPGFTRTLPTLLFATALAYAAGGFLLGRRHPPTPAASGVAARHLAPPERSLERPEIRPRSEPVVTPVTKGAVLRKGSRYES